MLLHGAALLLLLLTLAQCVVCKEDLYKVLGLERDATEKQLKSAYRQLSKKYHPDKNPGDEVAAEKFVEVSEAYEALSDAEMRSVYDRHGHEGLKQRQQQGGGGFHTHDPFDLFSRFFGGGGHYHQPGQRRGPSMELGVQLPLRDFYLGVTTEFQWNKQQICEDCDGTGAQDGHLETCSSCGGQGMHILKTNIAPGMFTQRQVPCDQCGGRGKTPVHACPICEGHRVLHKPTTVPLTVQPGAARGFRIVYENEADASPDFVAGDLIVTLMEKTELDDDNPDRVDGAYFRRRDDDLYWTEVISGFEAMFGGWTRNITHLDGQVVRLGRKAFDVVQPNHVERVEGKGMPKWHEDGDSVYHKTEFGDLYVEYVVVHADEAESGMMEEMKGVYDKWMAKIGVDLFADSGRPEVPSAGAAKAEAQHEEL